MRIPRSAIVMGLVTAVPFGLGIRDTLTKKPAAAEDALDGLGSFGAVHSRAERERELAAYEEEMRREAERDARSEALVATFDQLYGAHPAAMGSLFEGLELGSYPEPSVQIQRRIDDFNRDGIGWVTVDGARWLETVAIRFPTDDTLCERLQDRLVAAWGHSVNGVWLDPATHQRAAFLEDDGCELRFERYLDAADFVAQLPLAAIGTSADKYVKQLGDAAEFDGERITRELPGVGAGTGLATIELFVERGKIVGFTAKSGVDFDSLTAIRDGLSARFKAQPTKTADEDDADAAVWEWTKRRTPASLVQIGTDEFSLTVGTLPWD